jgi:hypothetical protein
VKVINEEENQESETPKRFAIFRGPASGVCTSASYAIIVNQLCLYSAFPAAGSSAFWRFVPRVIYFGLIVKKNGLLGHV